MYKCGLTGHSGVLGSKIKKINGIKFFYFKGDITKIKDIEKWLSKYQFDLIIHLAAIVPTYIAERNFKYANLVNYYGTKYLVDCIIKKQKKIKWFFYSSTSHVYKIPNKNKKIKESFPKKPLSKYGITKLKAEKYIVERMKNKVPFCIGRIFSFTDFKQESTYIIPSIFKKIKNNKKKELIFSNLNHYRDFTTVEHICYLIKKLWINKKKGIFNIASSKSINLKSLPLLIKKKMNKKFKIKFKDNKKSTYLVANIDKIKKLNLKKKSKFEFFLNKFIREYN